MGIKASRSKRSTVRTETTAQPQRHDRAHLGLPRSRELVWLITGPSSVFARRLIDSLVAQGDKIVAVGWNTDKLQDLPQNDQVKVMQLDLAEGLPILELKIAEAVGLFGRIDVLLLQHGGISVQAIAREGSTSDRVKKKHSTHVHGVLDLTNAVLPHMRMQQSGTIVLIGNTLILTEFLYNRLSLIMLPVVTVIRRTLSVGFPLISQWILAVDLADSECLNPEAMSQPGFDTEFKGEKGTGQLVWLITGASSILARRLIDSLLARGDKIIATGRSTDKLQDLPKSDRLRIMQLDVTDGLSALKLRMEEAIQLFGRINVLVNNAGISVKAIVEEGGSDKLKKQFDTNVYGLLDVTNAVLPHMRSRRSGTIVLIGSRSSWRTEIPTVFEYSTSKAAVRVIGETLSVEIAPFSIRVLIVEPADFLTNGSVKTPVYEDNKISDYDEQRKTAKHRIEVIEPKNDPAKGMEILADVVRGEGKAAGKKWPLYLPLGPEAEQGIREKMKLLQDVLDEWGPIIGDTRIDES
ncbi:hypothetical protein EUX98_g847 [Antrodiella citrinella]|uniref:NAD(P)-binding domain-containing protein n=1 Tax=Antrodiella citrinella TaxID=2447956 RepID=A0A4S4N2Y2_9APHY|nr:hypothetical protein EUX98_g847 [Antrodiella citrinella]